MYSSEDAVQRLHNEVDVFSCHHEGRGNLQYVFIMACNLRQDCMVLQKRNGKSLCK